MIGSDSILIIIVLVLVIAWASNSINEGRGKRIVIISPGGEHDQWKVTIFNFATFYYPTRKKAIAAAEELCQKKMPATMKVYNGRLELDYMKDFDD